MKRKTIITCCIIAICLIATGCGNSSKKTEKKKATPQDKIVKTLKSDGLSKSKSKLIADSLYKIGVRSDNINSASVVNSDQKHARILVGIGSYPPSTADNNYKLMVYTDKSYKQVVAIKNAFYNRAHKTTVTFYKSGKKIDTVWDYAINSDNLLAIEAALDDYASDNYSDGETPHENLVLYKYKTTIIATGTITGKNSFGSTVKNTFTARLHCSGKNASVKIFNVAD